MPTRIELERAATNVVGILKNISEYSEAKIAIIGGLALWKYIPNGRTTQVLHSCVLSDHTSNSHDS